MSEDEQVAMVVVEFAGPSCSGKSTLVRHLERVMTQNGVAVRRVSTAGPRNVLRGAGKPRIAAWCLLNPRLAGSVAGRQLLGAIGAVDRLRPDGDVVLLDEGPVKLHSRRSMRRARGSSWLLSGLPVPDVLVVVTCDPDVRLARLRREARPHARARSDSELLGAVTGDHFARQFARARGVAVIDVDTTSGTDPTAEVDEALRRFYAPVIA